MSRGYRTLIRHGIRRGLPSLAGFTRRDFLKTSAKLSAAAMLAPALSSIGCGGKNKKTQAGGHGMRVVVVGAGFGGLACADTLMRGGADVTVLEAESRPGGRVLSNRQFLPGAAVELGGEYIGTNHPHWIGFAKRFELELVEAPDYEGDEPIILGGKLIRGEAADTLFKDVDKVLAKFIEMAQPIDPVRPYTSPNAADLDAKSVLDIVRAAEVSDLAKAYLLTTEQVDNGVLPDRMSVLGYLAMVAGGGFKDYWDSSETHRLAGGNDRLAAAFAKELGGRVHFNTTVESIRRMPSHAVVTTTKGSFECDAVVVAVPPSVWQRIAFNSGLQGRIPQMGKNVKLLLKITSPVWEEPKLTPEAISDGLVGMTWVSGETEGNGPKSFTCFAGANQAELLRRLNPGDRTIKAIESLKPAFPTLADATIDSRFMDWPSMPRVLASYSFPAPGQVTALGPTLVEGPKDNLAPMRFAGEHTSYSFIGYMEGALESGVRAANSLLGSESPATTAPTTMQA